MSLKDATGLVHFRELHLLPRTIFSIGATCFIGAFFIKVFLIGFLGVGIVFSALTINFVINAAMQTDISLAGRRFTVPWVTLGQLILCFAITYKLLFLICFFYRHGEMPPYLQPLSPPH